MKTIFRDIFHENELLKKNGKLIIFTLVLAVLIIGLAAFFGRTEYDAEQVVRTSIFEEYTTYKDYKTSNFGGIVFSYVSRSQVRFRDKAEEDRFVLSEDWSINEEIIWLDEIKALRGFDPEKEDLVCVTVSEHINFVEYEGDGTYSCIFAVDKDEETAVPIMFIETLDGEMTEEPVTGAGPAIDAFYKTLRDTKKVVDYLKAYK